MHNIIGFSLFWLGISCTIWLIGADCTYSPVLTIAPAQIVVLPPAQVVATAHAQTLVTTFFA
jgi:hypothetical protein